MMREIMYVCVRFCGDIDPPYACPENSRSGNAIMGIITFSKLPSLRP